MRRYLVVANQTLEGPDLRSELSKRIEAEPSSFYVLVPNTSAAHYHVVPAAGGMVPMPSMVTSYGRPETDEEASAQARHRLERLLDVLTASGVEAEGNLGSANPLEAIANALADRQFDEIIVATLPRRFSRWLKADLPHQAERRFGLPVTTIVTKA
ncbi:universal stress protein [Pseudonocardia acidicola]|uniref:Universal stress protein n=1 Tax=Pseudonocardia acidicola TaxID=2724939 RepID=A0ABX1S840_9PSEU|nr:universal stress protein [Pseudonocardia acidicola]NMH97735.1 universal stress protein [Pseudonocardia acidicola]